jgi:FtsH-binding integral membrane protein
MEIAGLCLILLGSALVLMLIGGIWFLVAAFSESILWGLACLFIPLVQLFFLIVHWNSAKKPFGLQLLGLVAVVAGIIISPNSPRLHH